MPVSLRQDEEKKGQNGMRSPGIEPGSITWQATIITTRPRTLDVSSAALLYSRSGGFDHQAPLAQSVEYWSYEPKVAGSSPAWSILFLEAWDAGAKKGKKRAEGGFEPLGR